MILSALLINDDRRVNDILATVLKAWKLHRVEVQAVGFGFRGTGTMKESIDAADICIVGLERQYPWGRRAEGIEVAQSLWRMGKKALIISGEEHSAHLNVGFYWDFAAGHFITEAVTWCLEHPLPQPEDCVGLTTYFQHRMRMPSAH